MKLFRYFIIRLTTKEALTAAKIYQMIYNNGTVDWNNQKINSEKKEGSKKEELIKSLNYLKSKEIKTRKDRESISIIESVLVNM